MKINGGRVYDYSPNRLSQCSSCWNVSTTTGREMRHVIARNELITWTSCRTEHSTSQPKYSAIRIWEKELQHPFLFNQFLWNDPFYVSKAFLITQKNLHFKKYIVFMSKCRLTSVKCYMNQDIFYIFSCTNMTEKIHLHANQIPIKKQKNAEKKRNFIMSIQHWMKQFGCAEYNSAHCVFQLSNDSISLRLCPVCMSMLLCRKCFLFGIS